MRIVSIALVAAAAAAATVTTAAATAAKCFDKNREFHFQILSGRLPQKCEVSRRQIGRCARYGQWGQIFFRFLKSHFGIITKSCECHTLMAVIVWVVCTKTYQK